MIRNSLLLLRNNIVVVKSFSLLSGLRAVQLCAGLASTYFVVRAISQAQFGYYQFVVSTAATLTIFGLPEMNNAVMQSLARGFSGTYYKAIKTVLLSSIGATIIMAAMAAWYFLKHQSTLGFALIIAAVLFPLSSALILWKGRRVARENFAELVRLDGLNSVATSLAIIAAVIAFPGNYLIPVAVFFLGPALRNVLTTLWDMKHASGAGEVEQGIIEYGVSSSVYSGLALLAERLDNVILFFFLPPAAVALYASANRLAELFRSLTQDIAATLSPRLAKKARYTRNLDDAFRLYSLTMGAALVVFAFAVLPFVYPLIFTHSYDAAIPYAQALICAVAVGNLAQMRFRFIRSRIDVSSYRNVMLLSAVAKLASLFLLVPLFGLAGAAASAFVYRLTMLSVVHYIMKRRYSLESLS